jgi:hypothetical protein
MAKRRENNRLACGQRGDRKILPGRKRRSNAPLTVIAEKIGAWINPREA